MKEVVIHLGVHKTGTSSIQQTLSSARQTLAANGILYPDILRKPSHFDLYTCFHERPLEYRMIKARGITRADEVEKLQAEIKRSFEAQLASSAAERVILSSEAFSLMNAREMQQFISYLGSCGFKRTQFIVYLRDYITYWESDLQQKIKGGAYIDLASEERELRQIRRYQSFLETLRALSDRDSVKLRLFHSPLLKNGDAVADFLEQVQISDIKPPGEYLNEALTKVGMIAVNELNKRVPHATASVRFQREKVAAALRASGGAKYYASPAVMQRIVERTKEDREYLAQYWFSGRDYFAEIMHEVMANPARTAAEADRTPDPDEIMDVVALFYATMQREAAEQGAERWLATARLARSQGRDRHAQRAMNNYQLMKQRIPGSGWEPGLAIRARRREAEPDDKETCAVSRLSKGARRRPPETTVVSPEVLARIQAVRWHHSFEVVPGITSKGAYNPGDLWRRLNLDGEIAGKRVLDLGARDGFFSFQCEELGAEVLAVDYVAKEGTGFALAAELRGSSVEHLHRNLYSLSPSVVGTFDYVLMLGVIYHVPDPYLALEIVRSLVKTGGTVFVESVCIDDAAVVDDTVVDISSVNNLPIMMLSARDSTSFWDPNSKCLTQLIERTGFAVTNSQKWGDRILIRAEAVYNTETAWANKSARGTVSRG